MTERRVAEIMGERQRFREVFVEAELAGHRTCNLGHLERVCQTRAVMVALVEDEHLRLVLEAAEGGGMDDTVAIAAKRAAAPAWRLGDQPATALRGVGRVRRVRCGHADGHRTPCNFCGAI